MSGTTNHTARNMPSKRAQCLTDIKPFDSTSADAMVAVMQMSGRLAWSCGKS